MDLRELRLSLRRHWIAALVAFDICLLVGVAAAYLPDREYSATVTLVAEVRDVPGATPESVARAVAFELPGLVERVKSQSAATEASGAVASAYRDLDVSISAGFLTSVFDITASSTDPNASAQWADALAAWLEAQREDTGFYGLMSIDPAIVPSAPSSPKPVPLIAGATILGLIAAVFAAVVVARVREAFDSTEAIRQRLGASILSEIPSARALRRGITPTVELLENGVFDIVDSFQGLRTYTELQMSQHGARTIAVTSFRAGEGKSTVAAGLGWSLAAVGHDVIMIDADLRRPALHRRLGETTGYGLADLGDAMAIDFVRPTAQRGLSFLPAGLPDGRPGDLIPVTLPRAIDELESTGSVVIVDAPPMREVSETTLILAEAKYVILVVDASTSELPEIAAAVERLRESGATLLGVVINRVRRRLFDRKSPYYGKSVVGAKPVQVREEEPVSRRQAVR